MKFLDPKTGQEIISDAFQGVMPDGSHSEIMKDGLGEEAVHLRITADPERIFSFSIEPRATNLVAIGMLETRRAAIAHARRA